MALFHFFAGIHAEYVPDPFLSAPVSRSFLENLQVNLISGVSLILSHIVLLLIMALESDSISDFFPDICRIINMTCEYLKSGG